MRGFAIIILFVVLSGCFSTMAEVRQSSPVRIENFPSSPSPHVFAFCVQRALDTQLPHLRFLSSEDPTSHQVFLAARYPWIFNPNGAGVMEITFLPVPSGTRVEVRQGSRLGDSAADEAWPIMTRCSQQATPPTAPSAPAASPK